MSKSLLGGLLLVMGLAMLGLFTFGISLPEGLGFVANFVLGVVPAVVGAALVWAGFRGSVQRRDPEAERLNMIKDQVVWRAMAQGGRITASEVASHGNVPPLEAEHALMTLVAEGRAFVESADSGVVYRVEVPGLSTGGEVA